MRDRLSRYSRKQKKTSDYCYEDTEVLINKKGIKNAKHLAAFERDITAQRLSELELENPIRGRFSPTHLKRIHEYIFQDIYPFAGKYRLEDMWKETTFFCKSQYIHENLTRVLVELRKERYLKGLDKREYSLRMAYYMAEMNMIHPFREGNGRTIREFIRQLALKAGYIIEWSLIKPESMLHAMKLTVTGDLVPLAQCIEQALVKHHSRS